MMKKWMKYLFVSMAFMLVIGLCGCTVSKIDMVSLNGWQRLLEERNIVEVDTELDSEKLTDYLYAVGIGDLPAAAEYYECVSTEVAQEIHYAIVDSLEAMDQSGCLSLSESMGQTDLYVVKSPESYEVCVRKDKMGLTLSVPREYETEAKELLKEAGIPL